MMSLTSPIVGEETFFLPLSLEEIDSADERDFFCSNMFPDISTTFPLYNCHSSSFILFAHFNDNDNKNINLFPESHLNGFSSELRALIPFDILSEKPSFLSLAPTDSSDHSFKGSADGTEIGYDVESFNDPTEINLSPYFCLSQREAAQKLGIRVPILIKKWREVTNNKM